MKPSTPSAHSFTMQRCSNPDCHSAHVIARDRQDNPICDIAIGQRAIPAFIEALQDFLYVEAVERGDE